MDTDGGGWTLVGSTLNQPLSDEAAGHYADLQTLAPAGANTGIWVGLRDLQAQGNNWDVRFACRVNPGPTGAAMDVDLSFYDTPWYREFTAGTDADSCFNEGNGGANMEVVPARRNNITGDELPEGDQWAAGFLEGEDSCDAPTDFTVDFDDRGMDSNQSDGTDWGQDDGARKCGQSGIPGGQWFIFVRASEPDDGDLRLQDGGDVEGFGRLEIYFQGQWGTICDDGWSGAPPGSPQGLTNAEVACRQLGYRGALAADNPDPVNGVDPIWLDDVSCQGDEARLA
ncbi:MAG: scavenger receptor cysteine-rich domain-containing protein, partial [Myxococcales bacterium]|nr:scavenger receptor cysteine-rich domain-containing protein [Myxococcales bacterium]